MFVYYNIKNTYHVAIVHTNIMYIVYHCRIHSFTDKDEQKKQNNTHKNTKKWKKNKKGEKKEANKTQ